MKEAWVLLCFGLDELTVVHGLYASEKSARDDAAAWDRAHGRDDETEWEMCGSGYRRNSGAYGAWRLELREVQP